MPSTFPLLRLPIDERLAVLRQMESIHLFLLSLASKRAKSLVTSANRKAQGVSVSVERKIQFSCYMFQGTRFDVELAIWKKPNEPRKVNKPRYVRILQCWRKVNPIECKKEEYEAKDWLEHLCQIFHQRDHGLTFHGSFYDLDSVYEHFKNPVHLNLHSSGNAEYDNRVLTMFIPKTAISLDLEIFKNARLPKHILVQNYDSFNCHGNYQVMNQKFPFNALLFSNSQEITTTASGFSVKDINKFLKLWIRGSNPRLQKLLMLDVPFNYDAVLRGIQNCVVSEDQENVFKSYTVLDDIDVKRAREIRRMDGTVAGIVVDDEQWTFNFFILHDRQ